MLEYPTLQKGFFHFFFLFMELFFFHWSFQYLKRTCAGDAAVKLQRTTYKLKKKITNQNKMSFIILWMSVQLYLGRQNVLQLSPMWENQRNYNGKYKFSCSDFIIDNRRTLNISHGPFLFLLFFSHAFFFILCILLYLGLSKSTNQNQAKYKVLGQILKTQEERKVALLSVNCNAVPENQNC